jgi:hypothetical protein
MNGDFGENMMNVKTVTNNMNSLFCLKRKEFSCTFNAAKFPPLTF